MKIIAGKYKGRVVSLLEDSKMRPTRPQVREAVFNIISSGVFDTDLEGASIVDICCGSASYAMEAISRGASKIVLVEKDRKHLDLAKKNINKLSAEIDLACICYDARFLPKAFEPADVIFVDPPYNFKLVEPILSSLVKNGWLHKNSIVIVELGYREDVTPPEELNLELSKKYGISKILLFKLR
jgi:16S rRNA (guanine966-N2)-methyltransferase